MKLEVILKLSKIYIAKQFTFEIEQYIQKELLIYLLNGNIQTQHMDFVKGIPSLPFELSDTASYIEAVMNVAKAFDLEGEIDEIGYDQPISKERMEKVNLISTNLWFPESYESDDESDLD